MRCGQIFDLVIILAIAAASLAGVVFGWNHHNQCSSNLPDALVILSCVALAYTIYLTHRVLYEGSSMFQYRLTDVIWTLLFGMVLGYLSWQLAGTSADGCSLDVYNYSTFAVAAVSCFLAVQFVYFMYLVVVYVKK